MAVVNITERAAGQGLKEALQTEANRRGLIFGSFVGRIYEYALDNKRKFLGSLETARPKGGAKIAGNVSSATAQALTRWAEARGTTRRHHCCYILEKALEDDLIDTIFGGSPA